MAFASFETKKREIELFTCVVVYGRFLRVSTIIAPTMAIAAIMPIVAGSKYWSAKDGPAVGVSGAG